MSWDSIMDEWFCTPTDGSKAPVCATGLASKADFALYAAAPVAGDAGWTALWKDAHDEQIAQDDGTDKTITINEQTTLKDAVNCDLKAGGPPKNGVWIGGQKYKLVQKGEEPGKNDCTYGWSFLSRPKKGAHILTTESTVIIALYDEAQGQTSGNCKKACIELADYMVEQGQ